MRFLRDLDKKFFFPPIFMGIAEFAEIPGFTRFTRFADNGFIWTFNILEFLVLFLTAIGDAIGAAKGAANGAAKGAANGAAKGADTSPEVTGKG